MCISRISRFHPLFIGVKALHCLFITVSHAVFFFSHFVGLCINLLLIHNFVTTTDHLISKTLPTVFFRVFPLSVPPDVSIPVQHRAFSGWIGRREARLCDFF